MIKLCLYEHPVTGELFINFWWLCFMSCFETNNEWVETCTEGDREKRGWDRERWKKDRGGGTYSGSGCSTGGSWGGHFWSGRLSLWSCRLTVPYTLHTEERKVWIILNDLWIICYRHTLKNKVLVILDFFFNSLKQNQQFVHLWMFPPLSVTQAHWILPRMKFFKNMATILNV